jgi:sirohydrochlorin ferrochelatase
VVELAEAGFLNYSRPTMAEAIDKCVAQGATHIVVQPYFLIDGAFVRNDLPARVAEAQAHHPDVAFETATPFGAESALVALARKRVAAADPTLGAGDARSALLFLAHGTTLPAANGVIEQVAAAVGAQSDYRSVQVAYLDLNEPSIPSAVDALAKGGHTLIVAMPYFLHQGRHVAEDLPRLLDEAAQRWPDVTFILAEHLGYDLLLVDLIAKRLAFP